MMTGNCFIKKLLNAINLGLFGEYFRSCAKNSTKEISKLKEAKLI
jgi:hypothetical protein